MSTRATTEGGAPCDHAEHASASGGCVGRYFPYAGIFGPEDLGPPGEWEPCPNGPSSDFATADAEALLTATEAVAALFPEAFIDYDDNGTPFVLPAGGFKSDDTFLEQRRSNGRSWMLILTDMDVPAHRWHMQCENGRFAATSSTLGIDANPADVAAWFNGPEGRGN